MKTTKEMIEVMQAFERGEKIQIFIKGKWEYNCSPLWDWVHFDYRIKPEPKKKYVPFDTSEEFLAAQREKGMKINCNDVENYNFKKIYVDCKNNVMLAGKLGSILFLTLKELFKEFSFEDGTPCGKEVDE